LEETPEKLAEKASNKLRFPNAFFLRLYPFKMFPGTDSPSILVLDVTKEFAISSIPSPLKSPK